MKYSRNGPTAVVLSSSCFLLIAIPAYGYVDPNAAGMISQIVTPLLILAGACLIILRSRWERSLQGCRGACADVPMLRDADFRSVITSLWFRLITLAILALVFSAALFLAQGKAQGWTYYLTTKEAAFEIVVRLIVAALTGVAVGPICTAAVVPILWPFNSSRKRVADRATEAAVVVVVFLVCWFALHILIRWSYHRFDHRAIFDIALRALFFMAFAAALCIPRTRREVVTSLDGFLGER